MTIKGGGNCLIFKKDIPARLRRERSPSVIIVGFMFR